MTAAAGLVPADRRTLDGGRWRPSIHMPRSFARKLVIVVSVTPEPVVADGVLLPCVTDAEGRREGVAGRGAYLELWRKINGSKPAPAVVYRIEFSHDVGGSGDV